MSIENHRRIEKKASHTYSKNTYAGEFHKKETALKHPHRVNNKGRRKYAHKVSEEVNKNRLTYHQSKNSLEKLQKKKTRVVAEDPNFREKRSEDQKKVVVGHPKTDNSRSPKTPTQNKVGNDLLLSTNHLKNKGQSTSKSLKEHPDSHNKASSKDLRRRQKRGKNSKKVSPTRKGKRFNSRSGSKGSRKLKRKTPSRQEKSEDINSRAFSEALVMILRQEKHLEQSRRDLVSREDFFIKEIFSMIDKKRRGWFAIDDFREFLTTLRVEDLDIDVMVDLYSSFDSNQSCLMNFHEFVNMVCPQSPVHAKFIDREVGDSHHSVK